MADVHLGKILEGVHDTMIAIAPPPCGAMNAGRMAPAASGGPATGAAGIAIFLAVVAIQTHLKE
jgi:hypothetical protein